MDSWVEPTVPVLPVISRPLRLYDSASEGLVPVGPTDSSAGIPARMYVCGITPYDAAHLGHIATYLTFDLVYRYWLAAGLQVRYVQNITDIDDPLLERAERDGQDWSELAHFQTRRFATDMAALSVLPPHRYLGVVESMAEIVTTVDKLLAVGVGYQLDDGTGDVYFDLSTAPEFGYESHLDEPTMRQLFAERGGDPERAGKRNPLDPLLWRGARPGEPSWPSPMGPGRPGWHIECSVIAVNELGMAIDVQGGGEDLKFPHHEMSAAQAETATGDEPFARAYVHAGLLGWEGEKMSKSKGNLVFASDILARGTDPGALRLALFAHHYREHREWVTSDLDAAERRLEHWREASASPSAAAVPVAPLLRRLSGHLSNDLDTPSALAAVDEWAAAVLAAPTGETADGPTGAEVIDALLGVKL